MSFVINPITNRHVKVGSRTYQRLVKAGELAETHYRNDIQVPNFETGEPFINITGLTGLDLKKILDDETLKLGNGYIAVPGKGRYKGTIVKRNKPTKAPDMAAIATKASVRVIKNNLPQLADHSNHFQDDDEGLEKLIEQMIASEMLKTETVDGEVQPETEETVEIL